MIIDNLLLLFFHLEDDLCWIYVLTFLLTQLVVRQLSIHLKSAQCLLESLHGEVDDHHEG